MRLIALSEEGGSLVEERGAPTFVKGSESGRRYHLQRRGHASSVTTRSFTERECRAERVCDERGPNLTELRLLPVDGFAIAQTSAPGEVKVEVPGVGPLPVTFKQRDDRFDERTWMVALERSEPWVLYRLPASFEPASVRWFLAGDLLWLQLESRSSGLACLAASANLREAGAGILDDDAVGLLREKKFDEAQEVLERAFAINPADATVAYNLACAHALKGEEDAAIDQLARALSLDREGRLAALARRDRDLEALWTRDEFLRLIAPGPGP